MKTNFDVITKIRKKTNCSDNKLINEKIIDDETINLIVNLFRIKGNIELYTDVPISSIISLGRKNDTWYENQSWKDVVNCNLLGENWKEEVFEYFESELYDKEFPAPKSRGALSLVSYYGITKCENGNHRLAAAICWLASTYGHNATLIKVKTTLVPFDKDKIQQLKNLLEGTKEPLYINQKISHSGVESIIKIEKKYLKYNQNKLELIYEENPSRFLNFFNKIFPNKIQSKKNLEDKEWIEIPKELLEKLFNNQWFINVYKTLNKYEERNKSGY